MIKIQVENFSVVMLTRVCTGDVLLACVNVYSLFTFMCLVVVSLFVLVVCMVVDSLLVIK